MTRQKKKAEYNLPILEAFDKKWVELQYVERLANIIGVSIKTE